MASIPSLELLTIPLKLVIMMSESFKTRKQYIVFCIGRSHDNSLWAEKPKYSTRNCLKYWIFQMFYSEISGA